MNEGVAYVLALLMKWTLLEAFVVPTGAMAPTVYGAHADVTCQNCGMQYAVSMSRWAQRPRSRMPVHAACLNCGQLSVIDPRHLIASGDRIAVEKISKPRRWDLMVFKYPEDRRTTFIKRVVGMPGETLEIVDGDIFINSRRLRKEPSQAQDMWLPVHDSSRKAKEPIPGGPRWQAEGTHSSWKCDRGQWSLKGENATTDSLVFSGRITDEIAYNDKEPDPWPGEKPAPLVGDVKLVCDLEHFSGDGRLELQWEFRDQRVRARVAADGQVEMTISAIPSVAEERQASEKVARGRLLRPLAVARPLGMAIRDGHAFLIDDDQVVASAEVGPRDLGSAKKQKDATEPCRLAIVGHRCNVTLSRIVVWKDIYYRNLSQMFGPEGEPGRGCAENPIRLGDREYFTLGDNSANSKDSRFWGAVPVSDVVGVARWIYWPPGRWHQFR